MQDDDGFGCGCLAGFVLGIVVLGIVWFFVWAPEHLRIVVQ